jgi:putative spermidine/putrescine transport system ATP-binding protein
VQIGSPMELYSAPRTEFVADFVGEANVLRGTCRCNRGAVCVAGPSWIATPPTDAPRLDQLQDGMPARLVLRPEAITICAANAPDTANTCTGTLLEKIYLGVEFRLLVRLEDGQIIQVRDRDIRHLAGLNQGDAVQLCWHAADLVLLSE